MGGGGQVDAAAHDRWGSGEAAGSWPGRCRGRGRWGHDKTRGRARPAARAGLRCPAGSAAPPAGPRPRPGPASSWRSAGISPPVGVVGDAHQGLVDQAAGADHHGAVAAGQDHLAARGEQPHRVAQGGDRQGRVGRGVPQDDLPGVARGQGALVGADGGQGLEDVAHVDQLGQLADLAAVGHLRVAAAVVAPVVAPGGGHREHAGVAGLQQHGRADGRMGLDDAPLLLVQLARLEEDLLGDLALAHVVQQRGGGQFGQGVLVQAGAATGQHREHGHAHRVAHGVAVEVGVVDQGHDVGQVAPGRAHQLLAGAAGLGHVQGPVQRGVLVGVLHRVEHRPEDGDQLGQAQGAASGSSSSGSALCSL